jgi:hypothetical protein
VGTHRHGALSPRKHERPSVPKVASISWCVLTGKMLNYKLSLQFCISPRFLLLFTLLWDGMWTAGIA